MDRRNRLQASGHLYVIADRKSSQSFEFYLNQLKHSLEGGARLIQYRNKIASIQEMYFEALEVRKLTTSYQALLIINDRVDLALAVGADGIHIGQSDLPLNVVRSIVGEQMIVGQTCKTEEACGIAEANGADYIGTGAYYSTGTKMDAEQYSHEYLSKLIKNTALPVFGIGGIQLNHIESVIQTGCVGVAMSSAIMDSINPKMASISAIQCLEACFGSLEGRSCMQALSKQA